MVAFLRQQQDLFSVPAVETARQVTTAFTHTQGKKYTLLVTTWRMTIMANRH